MYYNYTGYYSWMFGVLQQYDFCDLCTAIQGHDLLVVAPVDSVFNVLPADSAKEAFRWTVQAFAELQKSFVLNAAAVTAQQQNQAVLQWVMG